MHNCQYDVSRTAHVTRGTQSKAKNKNFYFVNTGINGVINII